MERDTAQSTRTPSEGCTGEIHYNNMLPLLVFKIFTFTSQACCSLPIGSKKEAKFSTGEQGAVSFCEPA